MSSSQAPGPIPSLRALSLKQPYATLAILGEKKNETRSWRTKFRGEIAMHASLAFPRKNRALCEQAPFRSALAKHGYTAENLPRGCILGTVEITGCVPSEKMITQVTPQEEAFGDYSPERFAFPLKNPRKLSEPIPIGGALSYWPVPDHIEAKVREDLNGGGVPEQCSLE